MLRSQCSTARAPPCSPALSGPPTRARSGTPRRRSSRETHAQPSYHRDRRSDRCHSPSRRRSPGRTAAAPPTAPPRHRSPARPTPARSPRHSPRPARRADTRGQRHQGGDGGELGLGAEEKLVVRDVVQDQDGTTHTRYERTYAGLPVLGGDLVVATTKAGATQAVTKASKAALKSVDTNADVPAAAAEKQALSAAKAEGSTKAAPTARRARSSGSPTASRPSRTRRSSAASRRAAPRTSCTS